MKSMKFTLIMIVFFALVKGTSAQLNGTYTIGGTTPDYATIQAAVTALSAGVSGPVTFNIRPGTYQGKVLMGNVTGTSASNTITFKAENGDSTSVILTDSSSALASNNFTFLINGTDRLTIRNLTIRRSGTEEYASVFFIGGNSQYFQIRNCIVESDNTTGFNSNSSLVSIPLGTPNDSLATFTNSIFNNGYNGLDIIGQATTLLMPLIQVTNNKFNDQRFCAIQLKNSNAPVIRNNVISTNSTNFEYRGVSLEYAQHNFKVQENIVRGMNSGEGFYFLSCSGDSANEALISNNFISTAGTNFAAGLYLSESKWMNVYYNSVNITTTGTDNACLYLDNSTSGHLNVRNNNFVNTGGGLCYFIPTGGLANFTNSDYNNLYVGAGSSGVAFLDTAYYPTLADWQTISSFDSHSVSGDPQFISLSDLHAGNAIVNDDGVVISSVTTDIDGQTRSNSTPDIGADEFTPLSDNIGVAAILSPVSGGCGDSLTIVGVSIRNYGLSAQSGFSVSAELSGMISDTLTEVYSGSLVTNQVDTIIFSTPLITYQGGALDVVIYSSLSGDQYAANDTIRASFVFQAHPNAPVVVSPQQHCDNNVQITATPDSGDVLFWYDQPSGGNLLFTGNVFHPSVSTDTTFYVESHTGSGTGGCLRITEIEPNDNPSDFIEVQNLSGVPFDATGWKVACSLDNSDINAVNGNLWDLGYFAAGQAKFKTDNATDTNYWGSNLLWTGGAGSWAMIIDDHGNVVDFVVWDWDSTSIQSMNVTVNGFNISPGANWIGDGYFSCSSFPNDNQRIGSDDHDNASDWSCAPSSVPATNTNLSPVFTHCGVGFCGSPRLPIDITLIAGLNPVNLGNDTIISGNFTLTLDADTGYTSYLWSTGDTTQTLTVTSLGTYWVTVTGGTSGCSYTDSITLNTPVGITNMIGNDELSFYPNPATNNLTITGKENLLQGASIRVTDMHGRIVEGINWTKLSSSQYQLDINNLKAGIYFLQIVSGNRTGVQKFVVLGH